MIFTPQVLVGILAGAHFNLYIFDIVSLTTELCGGVALARYARTYSDTRRCQYSGALVFVAGGVATSRLEHVTQIEFVRSAALTAPRIASSMLTANGVADNTSDLGFDGGRPKS